MQWYLQKDNQVVTSYSRDGVHTNPVSILLSTVLFITESKDRYENAVTLYQDYHSSGFVSDNAISEIMVEINDYEFIEYTDELKEQRLHNRLYDSLVSFQYQALSHIDTLLSSERIVKRNLHKIRSIKETCEMILKQDVK
jgi:hypothetical protein